MVYFSTRRWYTFQLIYTPAERELRKWGCNSYIFKDIYHEAYSNFLERQKVDGIKIRHPHTYIIKMCKYLWIKEQKWHSIHEMVEEIDSFQNPEGIDIDNKKWLLAKHMKTLSVTCKEILGLYAIGFSEYEMSKALSLGDPKMVNNKKHYCKEKLKTLIMNDPYFDDIYG